MCVRRGAQVPLVKTLTMNSDKVLPVLFAHMWALLGLLVKYVK